MQTIEIKEDGVVIYSVFQELEDVKNENKKLKLKIQQLEKKIKS